jgi:hypothetical protein
VRITEQGHGGGQHDSPWRQNASGVGAVLMSLSTIIVAVNAQLLRRADL